MGDPGIDMCLGVWLDSKGSCHCVWCYANVLISVSHGMYLFSLNGGGVGVVLVGRILVIQFLH
jgi:hypothetical protein